MTNTEVLAAFIWLSYNEAQVAEGQEYNLEFSKQPVQQQQKGGGGGGGGGGLQEGFEQNNNNNKTTTTLLQEGSEPIKVAANNLFVWSTPA